jgi:hypothetical protein
MKGIDYPRVGNKRDRLVDPQAVTARHAMLVRDDLGDRLVVGRSTWPYNARTSEVRAGSRAILT